MNKTTGAIHCVMVNWEEYRREFPILEKKVYLNTCSLGALSRGVRSASETFMDQWDDLGAAAWYDYWLEALSGLRRRFARLIGARPEEVALAPNVSMALGIVGSCLNYTLKPRVVTSELDFPTLAYGWSLRPEVKVDLVPSPDGVTAPAGTFADHIDIETGLVTTSHVIFTTGYVQELRAVADLAHDQGTYLLVDAYQSAGQVPIDVRREEVDILIAGGLKWLLGGPGVVFTYVREELSGRLEPTTTGWFANAHQFDFDPRKFAYHRDARRFEGGTPAVGAVAAASAGPDIVLESGSGALRSRTSHLAEDFIRGAQERGIPVACPPDPGHRSGIVLLQPPDPAVAVRQLRQRAFIVDHRGTGVRVSPYFYNLPEEGEALLEALGQLEPRGASGD
jgi:selenocysteine lyase/cysteine desulfurase